jgi:predicted nucleic acid-binding protein
VPLELHPSSEIVEIAFSLAAATGRTVYDCLYVALATVLSAPLITADRKLYNALHHGKYSQHVLNLDEI